MPQLRVALAQTNPVVGFISGNLTRLLDDAQRAFDRGADVMVTGELALSGYPIEDLALRDDFLNRCRESVEWFAKELEARGLG